MSPLYILSAEAAQDLDQILEYVLVKSGPRRALHLNDRLNEAFVKLHEFPGIGHVRDDLGDEALRVWTVFSYLVIYRPKTSPLEIVRVLHGARDIGAIFGDTD